MSRRREASTVYYRIDDVNLPRVCDWMCDSLRARARSLAGQVSRKSRRGLRHRCPGGMAASHSIDGPAKIRTIGPLGLVTSSSNVVAGL